MRFQTIIFATIQKAVEVLFMMLFENRLVIITLKYYINNTDTNLATIHAKRVIIQIKNMRFVKKIFTKHNVEDF